MGGKVPMKVCSICKSPMAYREVGVMVVYFCTLCDRPKSVEAQRQNKT